ncbi:uncharacterized protein LOC126653656 [Mercurialis annua]|uniref:uncharacterized protein LOC126653656 n=1 Tax=Mercurialis annua TaxID=3986 RepID=UPI0021610A57|nr:uncharacterized protein LOC126653656 [Mercurialis annua]
MANHNILISLLLLLHLIFVSYDGHFFRLAEGGKRRIHITDDVDDVIDDEEDEAWKEWGKKSTASSDNDDPPPSDLSNMDIAQIQELMTKQHHSGPVFGFVKLRLGVRRTPDMVTGIALKWTKVLRTGALEVKFNGVDTSTIMFTMEKGRQAMELKEFILNQPEAYEIKIGDQIYRRPGDPPLEEVIEKLRSKEREADATTPSSKGEEHPKEEL